MSNETHAFPAIAPLYPNDGSVFVNNAEITSFSGADSGYSRLLNLAVIKNVDWPLVSAITALENHGSITAIRGPGNLYGVFSSSAVYIEVGGNFQFLNTPEGTLETNLRYAARFKGLGEVLVSNAGRVSGGDDGLRFEGVTALVENSGTIIGSGDFYNSGLLYDGVSIAELYGGSGSDGISFLSSLVTGTTQISLTVHNEEGALISGTRGGITSGAHITIIVNSGTIRGGGGDPTYTAVGSFGIYVNGGESALIRNSGEIVQTSAEVAPEYLGERCGICLRDSDSATIENSGSISGEDVGVRSYATPLALDNTGTISGSIFSILSYRDIDAQPTATYQLVSIDDVSPFFPGASNSPTGQYHALLLPEIAAETGVPFLLPSPRFPGDSDYLWASPATFPTTYTRPDGSTARIDLETGCQTKIEMSPSVQNRDVPLGGISTN